MADLDNVPKIVRNETFYLVARICIIAMTTIAVPIGSWMLSRVIAKADEISAHVTEQNVALKVLSATVESRLSNNLNSITDHEIRLRALERK